ncbi:MAG: PAS domain-containing methyl-accepting chemotaxis protein [Pseudomonadota bacterium]
MADVFSSVFGSIEAFVYRCRNDKNYTMEYIEGTLPNLLGYTVDDLLGNKTVSYVGLTVPEDVERVFGEVDASIAKGEPWDVFYHLTHKDGRIVPVRERGCAVYENGELVYLQGLVAGAQAETDLTKNIEGMLSKSQDLNADIVELTGRIISSLKMLHMLSINARVEAARSGEMGRGFAVVAEEIRKLSDKNADWADQIRQRIGNDRSPVRASL